MQRLKSGDAFWLGEQTDMSEIVGSWIRTTQKAYRFVWFSFVWLRQLHLFKGVGSRTFRLKSIEDRYVDRP